MEILFIVLLLLMMAAALGSGYPVAFALPGSAIATIAFAALGGYLFTGDIDAFFVKGSGPSVWLSTGVTNARGIYWDDESDILIAIPLFIFMGVVFQRSRIAEDLLEAMAQLLRPVPGAMAISVIGVGALLAATTGIVGATVVTMGVISLPAMLRSKYSKSLAAGTIAATGTLGQIIPPSIILIILVEQLTTAVAKANVDRAALYKASTGEFSMASEFDVLSVNAGDMFMGAILPGLLLVALYMLYVFGVALFRPHLAPKVPVDHEYNWKLVINALPALIPPFVLIFLVLGSLFAGIATVIQAGAIGAAGATIMAGYRLCKGKRGAYTPAMIAMIALIAIGFVTHVYSVNLRRFETGEDIFAFSLAVAATVLFLFALGWSGWRILNIENTMKAVVTDTARSTSIIFAILLGAVMFAAAFRAFGGEELVKDILQTLPGGFWVQFATVMLVIFVLGFYLDFVQITVVVVPIVAPILLTDPSANVTAVWLGVMMCVILQTSFLTPPFGFALFYLRGVAPAVIRTLDIYKGVTPFIAIQLLALVIIGAYPILVNYVPNRVSLLSDYSPPPSNPRLQYCIEEYVFQELEQRGDTIRSAIEDAKMLDLQILPENLREDLAQGFDMAASVFTAIKAINKAERDITAAASDYRPMLSEVRAIERELRRIDKEVSDLNVKISRIGGVVTEEQGQQARDRIAILTTKRNSLLEGIPVEWQHASAGFAVLLKARNDARRNYRRKVDDSYEALVETIATISDAKKLSAIDGDLRSLNSLIESEQLPVVLERIKSIYTVLGDIRHTSLVKRPLKDARKALQADVPKLAIAHEKIALTVMLFDSELAWRNRAKHELLPKLEAYEAAIADTIGIRGQSRLPKHVSLGIVKCRSRPRDIYLNF